MIDSCFSIRSDHLLAFIARLKHTNSGKKASCARQNAAFTPRKSIRSTIIRYDIVFRTTLQKNNTQKTKNNMLGNAQKQGQIGKNRPSTPFRCPFFHSNTGSETLETGANRKKSAAYTLRMSVFPLDSRLGNAQKQGQIGKNRPSIPFGCPFFHSNPGSEMLGAGANPKNRSLPFPDVVFPTKIPDYRVNNNYVNITEYVKLRYFL